MTATICILKKQILAACQYDFSWGKQVVTSGIYEKLTTHTEVYLAGVATYIKIAQLPGELQQGLFLRRQGP